MCLVCLCTCLQARFALEQYIGPRISTTYRENSFIDAVTLQRRDRAVLSELITNFGAQLLIITGTEYRDTATELSVLYPNVYLLLCSSLRTVLPPQPNMAFATGKHHSRLIRPAPSCPSSLDALMG